MGIEIEKVGVGLIKAFGDTVGLGGMAGILEDHKGWDPVVPHDLHTSKLPPVGEDGNVECWRCTSRLPFNDVDIVNEAYVCRPCGARATQLAAETAAAQVDVDTVKIGRGRWWILPLAFAGALAVCVAVYFA